jgi:hypothetical protein
MARDAIGVAIDLVNDEVSRLIRQLMEVPSANQVREVEGASTGAAAQYSAALHLAMLRAAKHAEELTQELESKYFAIRSALDALAEQDHVTRAESEVLVTAMGSTDPVADPNVPPPAVNPTTTGGF